ncbi:MAG: 50S ribosomal protein L16 [Candidatus Magasanikbacteria bacterium]|nr:50S ribosomal protein L16 [Candidatus Magasanikbacteria bacterium]
MLLPKKVQHRKWHKGRRRGKGIASRAGRLAFGNHGLKALGHAWVTSRQLEAARRVLTRYVRRGGKIWIRVFPDKPVTKKGNEIPMGGGKGAPDHYVAVVKPGTVLLEMVGVAGPQAREALLLAGHKFGVPTRLVESAA